MPFPPDTEFPKSRRPVVLFLRFIAEDAGIHEFLVQAHYERHPGEWERTTEFSDPSRPFVLPADRTVVVTDWITMPFVALEGTGRYAISVYFRRVEAGDDGEGRDLEFAPWHEADEWPWNPEEPGWVFGAVDYFQVVMP